MIVETKEELSHAMSVKADEIIVIGDLAKKLLRAKKVTYLGPLAIVAITAAIGFMPVTGGLSGIAAITAAGLTGLEIVAIIAVAAIGLRLVLDVFKEYEQTDVDAKHGESSLKMTLRRKRKDI